MKPSEKATALGNCIKEISKSKGISSKQLASLLKVDVKMVKKMEAGKAWLSFSQITSVADFLGISLEKLLKDSGIWN